MIWYLLKPLKPLEDHAAIESTLFTPLLGGEPCNFESFDSV